MNGLQELLSDGSLGRILRSFREATGLVAIVIDVSGEPVLTPMAWENCSVCRLVRASPEGRARCGASYADAGRQAVRLGNLYVFQCHAGLVNWAAPLVADSTHIGSVICGQVTMWDVDDLFMKEVADKTRDLGIEPSALRRAVLELEQLSTIKVQAAAELLFAVASYMVQAKDLAIKQRQEISRQQALLGEAIQERKRLEQEMCVAAPAIYSREKEEKLLRAVRAGRRTEARGILNDILVDIFMARPERLDILKARLLELTVVLSRAAVEAGAHLERLLGLNYHCIEDLSRLDTFDGLCFWIVQMLDQFMDSVREASSGSSRLVRDAVRYMRENLARKLTLEDVAAAVHVSPSHLSHVFKQETGVTVMENLTLIRLEEAKRLLSDLRYNVAEVAEKAGFSDPAHFSKCFKRIEGIAPSDFRRRSSA
ncbi:MAG: PocR ligand-binding domain-containing protein [Bacillota bacterium]|nr:PocR ligand-binding domain-containing protein [Bacillota bacterium]